MSKLPYQEFSDGFKGFISDEDAESHMARSGAHRTRWRMVWVHKDGKPLTRDGTGFKPHYNHALGKYVESRREFSQILNARGLIEGGNEYVPSSFKPVKKDYITDALVKEVVARSDESITDGEVASLRAEFNG